MSTQHLILQLIGEIEVEEKAIVRDRDSFDKAIQAREADLADKRAAVRVLEKREREQSPRPLSAQTKEQLELDSQPNKPKPTFTAQVTDVVNGLNGDINIATVFDGLIEANVNLPDVNPRTQISTILKRLTKRGILEQISSAAGVASLYRRLEVGARTARSENNA